MMRGFESDLMRIAEEVRETLDHCLTVFTLQLDCHVKSVQSSTEERIKNQIESIKGEVMLWFSRLHTS